MDPILEEMHRVKDTAGIRGDRFRTWTQYLCALVAKKDDEIATLTDANRALVQQLADVTMAPSLVETRRGPGRPRKEPAHVG